MLEDDCPKEYSLEYILMNYIIADTFQSALLLQAKIL